jgi:predicted nucleic acid-binding protein
MRAVCDTSSLIRLQRGGVIDCLGQIFGHVLIAHAVQAECRSEEASAALQKKVFQVRAVSHLLPLSGIQKGEQEAISRQCRKTCDTSSRMMKRHSEERRNRD